MSIYIKTNWQEMPKGCVYREWTDKLGNPCGAIYNCSAIEYCNSQFHRALKEVPMYTRPKWCPLVSIEEEQMAKTNYYNFTTIEDYDAAQTIDEKREIATGFEECRNATVELNRKYICEKDIEKHRADVAEMALFLMAKRCSTTCIFGKDEVDGCIEKEIMFFKQAAERAIRESTK